MNRPTRTTIVESAEWVLGLREPRPPSRFWMAYAGVFVAFCAGVLLWYALSGEWNEGVSISVVGSFFLGLWILAEKVGEFLYARSAATWGRGLRVFGCAVFPFALGCYLVAFWSVSAIMFVLESIVVGGWFVWLAVRLARLAWRSG